jgi:hypothetical protein
MSIQLVIEIENRNLSTLESPCVNFVIANSGKRDVAIAGPESLSIEVYSADGQLFRRMDGESQAEMLGTGSDEPFRGALAAGDECEWGIDFSNYHYPLPAGTFQVIGILELPNGGGRIPSMPVQLHVAATKITAVQPLRDNPVLDSLTTLIETEGATGKDYYLRLQSPDRPLASWYCHRIMNRQDVKDILCAQASHFQTENFDPFFRRWVVWREGEQILAHAFVEGQREENSFCQATLPAGHQLVGAYYDHLDRLFLLLLDQAGRIRCYQLRSKMMSIVFSRPLAPNLNVPPTIAVDEDGIHLLLSSNGLIYQELDYSGELLYESRLFRTRLEFHSARIDLEARAIRAIYRDGLRGKSVELFNYCLESRKLKHHCCGQLSLKGELLEIAFDRSPDGAFHLMVTTCRGKRYYYRDNSGPWLIGEGEGRCFPQVIAEDRTFLGSYTPEHGYRFLQFQSAEDLPRIQDYSIA